jgi:hypothetical protein
MMIDHILRVITIFFLGSVFDIIVRSEFLFLLHTPGADPACEYVAVTEFAEKLSAEFLFETCIAFSAQTHHVVDLPRTVEMRASPGTLRPLSWVVTALLANVDTTFAARQRFSLVAFGVK